MYKILALLGMAVIIAIGPGSAQAEAEPPIEALPPTEACEGCTREPRYESYKSNVPAEWMADTQKAMEKQKCPAEEYEKKIAEAQKTDGLKIVKGRRVDLLKLGCTQETQDGWVKGILGTYCRKSNTLVLRPHRDVRATKFHEFVHIENSKQMPQIDGQHPYDLLDIYIEKFKSSRLSEEDYKNMQRIALINLWDEARAFQMDLKCSRDKRFQQGDVEVLRILRQVYVRRLMGVTISPPELSAIYRVAKKTERLADFENSPEIKGLFAELGGRDDGKPDRRYNGGSQRRK